MEMLGCCWLLADKFLLKMGGGLWQHQWRRRRRRLEQIQVKIEILETREARSSTIDKWTMNRPLDRSLATLQFAAKAFYFDFYLRKWFLKAEKHSGKTSRSIDELFMSISWLCRFILPNISSAIHRSLTMRSKCWIHFHSIRYLCSTLSLILHFVGAREIPRERERERERNLERVTRVTKEDVR